MEEKILNSGTGIPEAKEEKGAEAKEEKEVEAKPSLVEQLANMCKELTQTNKELAARVVALENAYAESFNGSEQSIEKAAEENAFENFEYEEYLEKRRLD